VLHADLHMHSCFSKDCRVSFEKIVAACEKKGINCVALTDHGQIDGAKKLAEIAPFRVIIGEEVSTDSGEVIGLFINERIEPHRPLDETIQTIKDQGGLVYVPHPFDRLRGSHMDYGEFIRHLKKGDFDIVEGYNSRTTLLVDNRRAIEWAREYHVAVGAGSDAHSTYEIGNSYVEMDDFATKEEFLENLQRGQPCGKASPMWVHIFSIGARNMKKIGL
jgi:predicted metal-dependent phosphoesterase TrpH